MDRQDVIEQNYTTFLGELEQLSQGLIDTGTATLMKMKDYGIANIGFRKQQKIDDMTDNLQKTIFVNILYAIRSVNKKDFKVLAYSMPYEGQMYVILLESYMYGIIGHMTVTFYKSLDIMFNQMNEKYLNLESEEWQILESERPEEFFSKFMIQEK